MVTQPPIQSGSSERVDGEMQRACTPGELPRILLVDDQPARLLVYESILQGVGVTCVRAHSGSEALDRLLHETFAVILLDVSMPIMDGFETARLIRAHPRFERTPIIFVTGVHLTTLDALRGYESGAIDYLSVPIVPEILRSKVALLVELYRRQSELEHLNRSLKDAHERISNESADITAAHLATEQMRRLLTATRADRDWLLALLGSMNEEVYFTDVNERYTYVNPAGVREFGHGTVAGMKVEDVVRNIEVFRADGTPRPASEAPPLRALKGEIIRDEEQIVRKSDTGERRHRQVSAAPVRTPEGEIIGSVSVVRDITHQRRIEASLRDADERKDVFLASLSHELRNPLAPIRNAAQILAQPHLSESQLKLCQATIARQTAHMSALLDDLLDISRITHGKLVLRRSEVALRDVVSAACEMMQPAMQTRQHELAVVLPSSDLVLYADGPRLTQVLSNLLSNAAHFTPPRGRITLKAKVAENALEFSVQDSGVGLSPDMFPKLFQMFAQLEPAPELASPGLGIGLALARTIARLHDGDIEAHSAGRGLGSTFVVTLPDDIIVSSRNSAHPIRTRADPTAPLRVLIADDNQDSADTVATLAEMAGHSVHVAYSGDQALELAGRVRPQVALLDIGMPGMSGIQVAKRIRESVWGKGMTLVAITGWGQERDRQAAMHAGFNEHFTKPVDPDKLLELLQTLKSAQRTDHQL